ncbi:MAG: Maf family protein [bacterium]
MSIDIEWFNRKLNDNLPLILASASPRRRELLEQLNLKFQIIPSNIKEHDMTGPPEKKARTWAFLKADAIAKKFCGVILGADTIVVLGKNILGKPRDAEEARQMLRQLSGNTHSVITGLALINTQTGCHILESVETRVTFRILEEGEIDDYVASREPMDKAGAYGIQAQGAYFVKHLQGCYTNVVGLPVSTFLKFLREILIRKKSNLFSDKCR